MIRQTQSGAYEHFSPQYSHKSRFRLLGRQTGFVWLVILSVFVVSALLETRAGVHPSDKLPHLTPDICANFLAGKVPQNHGPRFSTYGLGQNPAPANLPNTAYAPKIGFEIAPQLPAHPNLPARGIAGWVEVDPMSRETHVNGQAVGHPNRLTNDDIVDACLALMSDK